MKTLEEIKNIIKREDPEVVAQLFASVIDDYQKLQKIVDETRLEEIRKLQLNLNLEEKLKLVRRKMFGRSSEKRSEATDRPRDKSQEEALLYSQAAWPSLETREDEIKGKLLGRDLNEKVVEHFLSDEELKRESQLREVEKPSAEQWQALGLFDQCTKINIIERTYVREIHKKFKYKLKPEFNKATEKDVIITASPAELLPGMNYTTEFIASIAADKYISHMPLERQTREMESLGLKNVKTSTLSRLVAVAAASLEPLQEKILKENLLNSDLALHLDETPWKIQNKNEKDGYMWVIANRYGSYYFFKPTRSGKVLREKLGDYDGPALTDGFSGYNILAELGIAQGFCWAHARREFLPLETHDPSVKPILDDIDELFAIEREIKSFQEIKSVRESKSKPVLDRLRQKLFDEHPKSRAGSKKRTAIEYITKRWDGLTLFATDPRLPLSNNEAERTIRHAVVGRKNYYGSGNHAGAETAATLFTVIESCKKNDLDPRSFLIMSLEAAARDEELVTPLAYAKKLRSKENQKS